MKKSSLIYSILLFTVIAYGQETFKKKYSIHSYITFSKADTLFLSTDSITNFENLTIAEKEILKNKYNSTTSVTKPEELILGGKKITITRNVLIDSLFFKSLSFERPKKISDNNIKGFVKFEEDGKLFVNRYLKKDSSGKYTRFPVAYYQLKYRQNVKLRFSEFSVSALVIPIKYRFKGKNELSEEFSTSINGNIFMGLSAGKTSFFHQEKVGNKSNTWKFTGGLLFGGSSVVLNKSNTSKSTNPITDDTEITKGLVNIGVGLAYSYNKINFGLFYGYDYAIGDDAGKWNYNKKPWLGVAIGYSLLNF